MKVLLPSKGVLGTKFVNLKPVTFADIRNVQFLNQEEELLKAQFTTSLINDVDLNKITKMDLDYLFTILAMQTQLNSVGFNYTCSCGESHNSTIIFGGQDLIEIPSKTKFPHVVNVRGTKMSYNILSAQQHIEACEYALQQDDFKSAYEDACVTFIFGKTINEIEWTKQLDISTFMSALLFQNVMFHGVKLTKTERCPKCGKLNEVTINPTTEMIKIDTNVLIGQYINVSSLLDFDNFLKITIPEFTTFREAIDAQNL